MVKRHIGWLFTLTSILVDTFLIVSSFNAAWWLRYERAVGGVVDAANFVRLDEFGMMRLGLVSIVLLVFVTSGIYRMPRGRSFFADGAQIVHAILTSIGLLVIALFIVRVPFASRLMLGYACIIMTLLLLGARLAGRLVKQVFWRRGLGVVRVLIVGDGTAARDLMRHLLVGQQNGRKLWGCLTPDAGRTGGGLLVDAGRPMVVPVLGDLADLDTVMQAHNIRQVIIALPSTLTKETRDVVASCLRRHVDFRLAPDLYGIAAQQVTVDTTFGRPLITIRDVALSGRRELLKRLLDIVLSVLVLAPFGLLVMLAIAVAIKLDSPGPVLFRQKRLTRDGSTFWVYKFRSMYVDAERHLQQLRSQNEATGPIFKMRDDPRLTRVGRWLRRASLDELPQIFNILLGEMSWVGPRPPLPAEVERYEEWQKRRLGRTTGLTGLWQVSGRSLLPFDEMVKLDLYYVENWSIWLDLKILLMTIPSVLKGKGAY